MSVETDLKPGADSQLQARPPAQSVQSDPAPATGIAAGSEQAFEAAGTDGRSEDEQEAASVRGSNDGQPGEQSIKGSGNSGEHRIPIDLRSKNGEMGEQSWHNRGSRSEKTGEQSGQVNSSSAAHITPHSRISETAKLTKSIADSALPGDELADGPASKWLKTLLPEVSGGWWDVYPKDNGFAVKFRWRDQRRQTLTFPRISYQHLQALKQSALGETGRIIRERISASLHRFLLDPDKRDKALLVARKLGIDLDDL